jgi:hypothetical protein
MVRSSDTGAVTIAEKAAHALSSERSFEKYVVPESTRSTMSLLDAPGIVTLPATKTYVQSDEIWSAG